MVGTRRIHAVLEQHNGEADIKVPFRAFKRGGVNLVSGPIAALISDKRLLALASTHGESAEFSSGERELIARVLPWSRRITQDSTRRAGAPFRIPEDLPRAQNELVMKKATSFGGAHVVVGEAVSSAEWCTIIRKALDEADWIVQDLVVTPPYLFHTESHPEGAPHTLVWGLFVFGLDYGGAFLRLQESEAASSVVNTHRGAQVGQLLEVVRSDDDRMPPQAK